MKCKWLCIANKKNDDKFINKRSINNKPWKIFMLNYSNWYTQLSIIPTVFSTKKEAKKVVEIYPEKERKFMVITNLECCEVSEEQIKRWKKEVLSNV